MLHVGNQDVELTSVIEAQKKAHEAATHAKVAETKEEAKDVKKDDTEMIDTSKKPAETHTSGKTPVTQEQKEISKCRHGPNQKCINCLGVTKENAEYAAVKSLCQHPPGGKCPNCIKAEEKVFKHESFDNWIVEQRKKCEKSHPPNAKCQNCTFV